jgi:3-hydroxyisobutyrate dehydrogenase
MTTATTTVAVLGTGIMGAPMARNLAAAGHEVRAWNRSRERAAPLAADGVAVAGEVAEAVRGADVVVTMLADADAVLATVDAAGDLGGAVWAQMSTVGIAGTERCAALAAERGVAFVDAPVLGTRQPAEAGALTVLASGADEARAPCEPVFAAVGARTLWLGEAGAGTRLKLVANAWVLALTEATAETFALAEGLGLDPRQLLDVVAGGPLDVPYLRAKGQMILERDFPPAFSLRLAAKDARLVEEAAGRHGLDLPLLATVADRLGQGVEAGHGDEDMAATWRTSAPGAPGEAGGGRG